MRFVRIAGIGAAVLFFASAASGYAQNDRHLGQDKQKPPETRGGYAGKPGGPDKQQAKPREPERGRAPVQRRGRQQAPPSAQGVPRSKGPYPGEVRSEQQVRAWENQRGWSRGNAWKEHATWRQHRASRWEVDHRTWVQRGGYGGFYIPEEQFHLYFGVGHYFRIRTRPVIVMGYPRFQYRGYSFMLVDPWPENWPATWYLSDDVYIDYDNGYYLRNRRHPEIAIAVAVVF